MGSTVRVRVHGNIDTGLPLFRIPEDLRGVYEHSHEDGTVENLNTRRVRIKSDDRRGGSKSVQHEQRFVYMLCVCFIWVPRVRWKESRCRLTTLLSPLREGGCIEIEWSLLVVRGAASPHRAIYRAW